MADDARSGGVAVVTLRPTELDSDGYGASLGAVGDDLWVAATTNVAHVWRGDALQHSARVVGFLAGAPGIDGAGAIVRVGLCLIDASTGEVVGHDPVPEWLVADLDDRSVGPADFSTSVVAHVPESDLAVVRTDYIKPRGVGAGSRYRGPKGRVLLVDVVAGQLVRVLVADAGRHRSTIGVTPAVIVAASGRDFATWSVDGEPLGAWTSGEVIGAVAPAPHSARVATLDSEGLVTMHTTSGGELLAWQAHDGGGGALAWHPTRPWLASASREGTVAVWDMSGDHPVSLGEHQAASVAGLCFVGGDRLVAAGDRADQSMVMLNVEP